MLHASAGGWTFVFIRQKVGTQSTGVMHVMTPVDVYADKNGEGEASHLPARSLDVAAAAITDGMGQLLKQYHAVFPSQARIGNGLSVGERFSVDDVLAAFNQVRFDHDAENGGVAVAHLFANVFNNRDLVFANLAGIRV